jgi:hypothetical protein
VIAPAELSCTVRLEELRLITKNWCPCVKVLAAGIFTVWVEEPVKICVFVLPTERVVVPPLVAVDVMASIWLLNAAFPFESRNVKLDAVAALAAVASDGVDVLPETFAFTVLFAIVARFALVMAADPERCELVNPLIVFDPAAIVLLVSVSVVARATSVSVVLGTVIVPEEFMLKVPELLVIDAMTGVVRVLFVSVHVWFIPHAADVIPVRYPSSVFDKSYSAIHAPADDAALIQVSVAVVFAAMVKTVDPNP